jgi:iron-sulfur cluster assembly protein
MATATATSDITITEKAKEKLLALKAEAGLNDSYGLRVSVQGGGCSGLSYKLDFDDTEQPGDQIFEDKGLRLYVNLKSFLYLAGTQLEFSDGLDGKGFHFNNPNAARSCGCGESFSV